MTSSALAGKTVLIVDDEGLFVDSVCDGLALREPELRTLKAADGQAALEVLDKEPVDCVVSDLRMPRLDGFGLLAAITRRARPVPTILTTAFGTSQVQRRADDAGAVAYLEKPVTLDDLHAALGQALSRSRVQGFSLGGFLQLVELDRKSCVVRITPRRDGVGEALFYFRNGELLDAAWHELEGEAAALAVLTWEQPLLEIHDFDTPRPRRIRSSLSGLLLRAAQRQDEARAAGAETRTPAPPRTGRPGTADPKPARPRVPAGTTDGLAELAGFQRLLWLDCEDRSALVIDPSNGRFLSLAVDETDEVLGLLDLVDQIRHLAGRDGADGPFEGTILRSGKHLRLVQPLTAGGGRCLALVVSRDRGVEGTARHELARMVERLAAGGEDEDVDETERENETHGPAPTKRSPTAEVAVAVSAL